MKIQLSLCLLTLLCFLWSSSAAPVGPQLLVGSCCSCNINIVIPRGKVMNVTMSATHCKLRSVIVTTKGKKRFCLDPNGSGTQRILREFGKNKRLH